MTLVIGASCIDGVVLIADRKVSNSKRLVDKIRKPENVNTVFSAGGYENVFEDYLDDLSKNVDWTFRWFEEENKDIPENLHREYDVKQFKKTCIDTLTELKTTYRALGENVSFEHILQVIFTLPETRNGTSLTRLYSMDMHDCSPQAVDDNEIVAIGYEQLASPFLKSLEDRSDVTMKEVARVATFTIKYLEQEKLTDGAVGVGNQDPQIYFVPHGQEPKEIVGTELTELLKGVDNEVEKIKNIIGSSSTFLRS